MEREYRVLRLTPDERKRRLDARNRTAGEAAFFISDENLRAWAALFQPPDADELNGG